MRIHKHYKTIWNEFERIATPVLKKKFPQYQFEDGYLVEHWFFGTRKCFWPVFDVDMSTNGIICYYEEFNDVIKKLAEDFGCKDYYENFKAVAHE